jgi:signal transduction histidine kinase
MVDPHPNNQREENPMRALLATAALTFAAGAAFAQDGDYGSPEEARAMLERAVEAVEEDRDAALESFRSGDEFRDRDLYVFCGGEDGNFVVHPTLEGQSLRELEDRTGQPFGERIYEVAEEGEMNEVDYMWPRPNETEPVQKSSYVTKVDDLVCAVGYYQPEG